MRGVSLIQLLTAISVVAIVTAFAVKPIKGYLRGIALRNGAESIKYFILNARSRAVSNTSLHCGVVFRVNNGGKADSIFAFFDNSNVGANKDRYDRGQDSLYLQPIVFKAKDSLNLVTANPGTIIFRGDGSANTSLGLRLKLYNFVDSINVLASTGRVKVIVK
jgi:Tfp pilus assembly protein FimT